MAKKQKNQRKADIERKMYKRYLADEEFDRYEERDKLRRMVKNQKIDTDDEYEELSKHNVASY